MHASQSPQPLQSLQRRETVCSALSSRGIELLTHVQTDEEARRIWDTLDESGRRDFLTYYKSRVGHRKERFEHD